MSKIKVLAGPRASAKALGCTLPPAWAPGLMGTSLRDLSSRGLSSVCRCLPSRLLRGLSSLDLGPPWTIHQDP